MKTVLLLIAVLALILATPLFGFEKPNAKPFNDYINGSPSNAQIAADKNTGPAATPGDQPKDNSDQDAGPGLPAVPRAWKTCSADSDCTAAVADCVSWEPLNKKYLDKISENLKSCTPSVDPGFQPKTVCVHRVCKTTQEITGVSWAEWLSKIRPSR